MTHIRRFHFHLKQFWPWNEIWHQKTKNSFLTKTFFGYRSQTLKNDLKVIRRDSGHKFQIFENLISRSSDDRDFGNRSQISKIWFQGHHISLILVTGVKFQKFCFKCLSHQIRSFQKFDFKFSAFLKGLSDIVLAWSWPQCQIFFHYAKFCLGFRDRRMQGMKQMFKSKPPPPPELVRRLLRSLRNLDELTGSKNNEKREQEGKAIRLTRFYKSLLNSNNLFFKFYLFLKVLQKIDLLFVKWK